MIEPERNTHGRVRAVPADTSLEVTSFDVPLPHLPEELSGLTLVQLSDFHRGCGGTDGLICEAVEQANALDPDLVLLTGDFVNEHKKDIRPIAKMLSSLRAQHGKFAVLGNHDHRSDAIQLTGALEAAGISVLHNRCVEPVPGLFVAGVDDLLEGTPDIHGTLSQLPRDRASIFLCHNPNGFDSVPKGLGLLMLAGHTHGGQFALSFPSPKIICRWHLNTHYVHGLYRRGHGFNAQMYVNRGIGVTGAGPLARRINCPPEITQFRLLPAVHPDAG